MKEHPSTDKQFLMFMEYVEDWAAESAKLLPTQQIALSNVKTDKLPSVKELREYNANAGRDTK